MLCEDWRFPGLFEKGKSPAHALPKVRGLEETAQFCRLVKPVYFQ